MSHEDLMDCIDPIRTPAERQISALQREVTRLTAEREDAKERIVQLEDEYKYTRATIREGLTDEQNLAHPVTREKVLFIRQQRDALKRHLDAIAEALGQPIEHDARKYFKEYLPDQLAEMVTAIKRERETLRQALVQMLASAYPHPVEHPTMHAAWGAARDVLAGRKASPTAPAALDAGIKEQV